MSNLRSSALTNSGRPLSLGAASVKASITVASKELDALAKQAAASGKKEQAAMYSQAASQLRDTIRTLRNDSSF